MSTNTQQQWAEVESHIAENKTTLILVDVNEDECAVRLAETPGFQRWQDTDLAALVKEVD